jgi:hypothetical protein
MIKYFGGHQVNFFDLVYYEAIITGMCQFDDINLHKKLTFRFFVNTLWQKSIHRCVTESL